LDDNNIANIFSQKRQKLHGQIMVSENLILPFINDNYIVRYEQNINTHTKSIIGSFIRINERFGKELNSDIFHKSIKNAIDVYEKHPEFDDRTIISDNRVEFVLTAINSNTCYLVNSLISNSSEVVNGVPSTKWLKLAEEILNFQKPLSDYATFAFSGQIYLFHFLIWNIFILPQKEK
jgi:drug/metabolite transporter superfamily protein YnfA